SPRHPRHPRRPRRRAHRRSRLPPPARVDGTAGPPGSVRLPGRSSVVGRGNVKGRVIRADCAPPTAKVRYSLPAPPSSRLTRRRTPMSTVMLLVGQSVSLVLRPESVALLSHRGAAPAEQV